MAYRNRFGSTNICNGRIDNLSINWDFDYHEESIRERYPVFLFTPDMEDTREHYHIKLDLEQARKLHKWFGEFIKEKENGNHTKRSRSRKTKR